MKTTSIVLAIITLVLIGMIVYSNLNKTKETFDKDVFTGYITNMELEPMKLEGTGVYDRSCAMIQGGLTNCDAGIQTEKGLLNFNYKHNMQLQPCLAEGDKLEVEILDSEGKAKVRRLR